MSKALRLKYIVIYFLFILVFFFKPELLAQRVVHISGRLIDKETRQPIPFANVVLAGTPTGTLTDFNGNYKLEVPWSEGKLEAQLMGYQKQVKTFKPADKLVINFVLKPKILNLNEVTVTGKKVKYRNKGNPAVALIRKVIANKDKNRKSSLNFYQYDRYTKLEFALNNLNEDVVQSKAFKKFHFNQYADTAKYGHELYLPFFLKETLAKVYFRKNPPASREFIYGIKMTGLPNYLDKQGISSTVNRLLQNFDIYNNNVLILTNPFVSPISVIAPNIYKFRIIDTVKVGQDSCINLAFVPRNQADLAFSGHLYITKDNRYAVTKVDLSVPRYANLNFVKSLNYEQTYKFDKGIWVPSSDHLVVYMYLLKNKVGILAKRTDMYSDYVLNRKANDTVYSGTNKEVILPQAYHKSTEFWMKNRPVSLHREEKRVYEMTEKMQKLPAYKKAVKLMMLFDQGYWRAGPIDIGPVNTFYGFNDVEGTRVRLAAQTNPYFNKRILIKGNLAYGFKDKKYKYGGSVLWSLNKIALNERPTNTLLIKYQKDAEFPGMKLELVNNGNFLLSFKRGVSDKMLYFNTYEIQHYLEWGNGFSTRMTLMHRYESPGGNWHFTSGDFTKNYLITSEASLKLRYAPNEKYYQSMGHRKRIINKYPVFQLNFTQGFKGVLKSQFSYGKLSASVFKRMYLGFFGYIENEVEAGKVFGTGIPFPLLYLHRANQTYSYQTYSYNMMNFLEFVSDHYEAYFGEYHLNGWLFNQIPLIKHLKLRGVVTFKALFGGVTNKNNPNINPGLMQFPVDANGKPTTFILNKTPYMEAGIGVENIFKIFRVDLIKRLTYLNNPNVSTYGIRVGVDVVF